MKQYLYEGIYGSDKETQENKKSQNMAFGFRVMYNLFYNADFICYGSFFLPMFKYNSLTVIILSTCLIILLLRKNTNKILRYISIVINIASILLLIISLFIELPWYIEYLFWPIYILINFITLIKVSNNKIALLFYVVAGLSAFFTCFNEYHELYYSIYTVYYTIMVANVVINEANSQILIN